MQLEFQHASRVPLLRTPPEGFCSSSYKHPTPNGVKTVNAFLSRLRQLVDASDPFLHRITFAREILNCT